jgi:iron(III) transport system permease protein
VGELIYGSLMPVFGLYSKAGLTTAHFTNVLRDSAFWTTLQHTLVLAVGSATVTMLLGLAIGYTVLRTRSRLREPIDLLAWLPWLMPGIVIGLGLLWAYVRIPPAISPYGTLFALGLAYLVLGIPLASKTLQGALGQVAVDLEQCARVHGATPVRAVTTILVPLIWPAFAVGWMLTFFLAIREVSASILLYTPDTKVLSIYMVEQWRNGKLEEVAVISLLMLLLVFALKWVEWRVARRADVSLF